MLNSFSPDQKLPKPQPDFENLLSVLRGEVPKRPTLFEFFMNPPLYERVSQHISFDPKGSKGKEWVTTLKGFYAAGYDYVNLMIPGFGFEAGKQHTESTCSINEGGVIRDRASFDAYRWPQKEDAQWEFLDELADIMPKGMKATIYGCYGVLENVIRLVGYENLCFMIVDDEQLVYDIFEHVGGSLVQYFKTALKHDVVGAGISNDDWGFNTQTMLPPDQMRKFVFPWHKRIVEVIHEAGKPAMLHSCGYFGEIIDDVIDDMKFDGRHSYEDTILPVEEAYKQLKGRIAILGGIDLDYVCRKTPEEIYDRAQKMLALASDGGYALGSGNSIPEYAPDENYIALISPALESR